LHQDPLLSDLEIGFVFTLFLFAVLQFAVRRNASPYSALVHRFAGFSYSLYVLHFPLLLFFRTLLVPVERWQPTPAHLLCAASIGSGSLLFAWLVSLVTEAKTDAARTQLNRLLG
jgi:peptidoglycan/LPS O-acetylase OafA/YrhL